MKNKGLALFSLLLEIANGLVLVFSLISIVNQPTIKGTVSGLSLVAVLTFGSIPFLEHFRNRAIDNITQGSPPIDEDDIFFQAVTSKNNPAHRLADANVARNIATWEKEQQKQIKGKNAYYIRWEKTLFAIGVIVTLAIASYLLGFWHTPN